MSHGTGSPSSGTGSPSSTTAEPSVVDAVTLADLAERAGRHAATALREAIGATVAISTKSSPTDLVTATDRATEAAIITDLLDARPDDGILAEESGRHAGSSGVTWIIDPIDGTTNFVYGLAGFNISIAAAVGDDVVAAVVIDPVRDETFRAVLGHGATCNGEPLHPADPPDLARSLVGTGFSYLPERRRDQALVVASVIDEIRDIRRLGAAALDLCYVAAGRLDGYFESGLKPWDLAAGSLVVTEVGRRISGLHDERPDGRMVVAAARSIHDDLRRVLIRAEDDGAAVTDPAAPTGGTPSARTAGKFGRLGP